MKVIVPVAGKGSRLRPLTYSVPKVLLPVGGRTVIDYLVDDLAALQPDEVIFIVNYLGGKIKRYATKRCPFPVRFVHQAEHLGLGHAVLLAEPHVTPGEPVYVVLGDTVFETDILKVRDNPQSVICVKPVDDPRRFGVVEHGADGAVTRFVEKPAVPESNLAIVGIYKLLESGLLFDCLRELVTQHDPEIGGEIQLTDALQMMLDRGARFATHEIDQWLDTGKFETLLATNRYLLERRPLPAAYAGAGTTIVPPVAIGPGCRIENSVVGPHVSLGRGCLLRDARVANSILHEKVEVGGAVLADSVVGAGSVVRGTGAAAEPITLRLGAACHVERAAAGDGATGED